MKRIFPFFLAFWCLLAGCQDTQRAPNLSLGPPAPNPSNDSAPPADTDQGPTDSLDMGMESEVIDMSVSIPDAEPDSAQFEVIPYAVETRVGERRTEAGIENRITCQVLDQVGEPISAVNARPEIHPEHGFERTEVGAIGELAREYEIVCAANSLGLRDPTPAVWTVTPARAVRTVTRISEVAIEAGDLVTVECEGYDAYGNRTEDDEFEVHFDPPPRNIERRGMDFRIDGSGTFAVHCGLPQVEDAPPVALHVDAGLPATLNLALFPERPLYRVGSVVELVAQVSDQFGNEVSGAELEFFSEPELPSFGDGRFQCFQEGEYVLGVRVLGDTWEDRELDAEIRILVDYGGPGVDCVQPEMGQIIAMPEGNAHRISGTVADIAGVESLSVDGQPADIDPEGRWNADVPVRWGLNVHNIIASDGENEVSTFCAYYAADRFADGELPHMDALQLRLAQSALDDGDPNAPIRSLGDIIRRVINSQGLVDTVHRSLLAQNPIKPSECHVRVLGACLFRLGIDYTNYESRGPNGFDLNLVNDGMRTRIAMREQNLWARLNGTLGNRVRMRAEHITVDMTFNVGLRGNGDPDIDMRNLNEVSVGDLDADFSGILGFLLDFVFELFEGLVRNVVTDAIRDFLRDNIDRVLTDIFSNVGLGELSQGFNVPSLVGGPDIPLVINASLARLDFQPGRAIIGVNAQVDGPLLIPAGGVAMPLLPGEEGFEVPGGRDVGAAIKLGVLNQVMYRLWRAGYFNADEGGLVENVADDLPDGTEVFISFSQPPWVTGIEGESRIRVMVGPLSAGVIHPEFFAEPIRVRLATVIEAGVEVRGERDLSFEEVRIDEFYLSLAGAEVPDRARQVIEDTLRRVLQRMIDRALNDGLPSLPLPEFEIPADQAEFGLPAGQSLGIRQPRLTGNRAGWTFDGNFGE